ADGGRPSRGRVAHRRVRAHPPRAGAAQLPQITERYRVTGQDCFIVKMHAPTVEQIETTLDRFPLYGQTTTSIVVSTPVPPGSPGSGPRTPCALLVPDPDDDRAHIVNHDRYFRADGHRCCPDPVTGAPTCGHAGASCFPRVCPSSPSGCVQRACTVVQSRAAPRSRQPASPARPREPERSSATGRGICASGSEAPGQRPGTAAREPWASPRAIAPSSARTGDAASHRAAQGSPPPAPATPSPGGHQAG